MWLDKKNKPGIFELARFNKDEWINRFNNIINLLIQGKPHHMQEGGSLRCSGEEKAQGGPSDTQGKL